MYFPLHNIEYKHNICITCIELRKKKGFGCQKFVQTSLRYYKILDIRKTTSSLSKIFVHCSISLSIFVILVVSISCCYNHDFTRTRTNIRLFSNQNNIQRNLLVFILHFIFFNNDQSHVLYPARLSMS